MTTATDDFNARLAAVEANINSINTQLTEMRADIRQLNSRIDRVFYAVLVIGIGIIGTLVTLIFRLS